MDTGNSTGITYAKRLGKLAGIISLINSSTLPDMEPGPIRFRNRYHLALLDKLHSGFDIHFPISLFTVRQW
jgi:hypothetical protein